MKKIIRRFPIALALLACELLTVGVLTAALPSVAQSRPPAVGQKAPDFSLTDTRGKRVQLSSMLSTGPVVLIVLRGYPGYQCPFCTRQVHDYVENEAAFRQAGYQVVFVYPGPAADLKGRANEFLKDADFPAAFKMLLDPGYSFTNAYGLRWAAPQETAYPSTFLIDSSGEVFFAMSSKLHGGRSKAAEILEALPRKE